MAHPKGKNRVWNHATKFSNVLRDTIAGNFKHKSSPESSDATTKNIPALVLIQDTSALEHAQNCLLSQLTADHHYAAGVTNLEALVFRSHNFFLVWPFRCDTLHAKIKMLSQFYSGSVKVKKQAEVQRETPKTTRTTGILDFRAHFISSATKQYRNIKHSWKAVPHWSVASNIWSRKIHLSKQ